MKRIAGLFRFVAVASLACASGAQANFSSVFIFGDSLSDSGNNAIVFGPGNVTPVPIPNNGFIPTFPYASGRYTNNQVWAQSFAAALGLSALPSLAGGTDYAFGGARTGPASANLLSPFPPSLETQAANFLATHGNAAPASALYVVAGGGNNARDALATIAGCGGVQACVLAAIGAAATTFATDIVTIVHSLESHGAQRIVVWDTPDVGLAPAILASGGAAIGTLLAASMNSAMIGAIGSDPNVKLFDLFGLLDAIVANPAAAGLTNVTDACAQFVNCDPSKFLFWDGIHPTSAGHRLLSNAMVALVPEPASLALLGIALAGLAAVRRRTED